jgi:hypothetical protein
MPEAAMIERAILAGGELYGLPLLVLLEAGAQLSGEFRAHFSRGATPAVVPSCAIVVPSTMLRVLITFILRVSQKVNPSSDISVTQFFGDEESALKWLDQRPLRAAG